MGRGGVGILMGACTSRIHIPKVDIYLPKFYVQSLKVIQNL